MLKKNIWAVGLDLQFDPENDLESEKVGDHCFKLTWDKCQTDKNGMYV